jgi:hypothetical protein
MRTFASASDLANWLKAGHTRHGQSSQNQSEQPLRASFSQPLSLSALPRGVTHEFFVPSLGHVPSAGHRAPWHPPLNLFMALARQAVLDRLRRACGGEAVVWIGRRTWPYAPTLGSMLIARSLFVDPPTPTDRLWAIDQALRSPACAAVIADAGGLDMPSSRRLQLAAGANSQVHDELNNGPLALLARPPTDRGELSAAQTRWLITPAPGPMFMDARSPIACQDVPLTPDPGWIVELLRCKGLQPADIHTRPAVARVDHDSGTLHLLANVADRSLAPARSPPARPIRASG